MRDGHAKYRASYGHGIFGTKGTQNPSNVGGPLRGPGAPARKVVKSTTGRPMVRSATPVWTSRIRAQSNKVG